MTRERTPAPTDLRDFLRGQGWSLVEAALRDRLYVLENAAYPRRQFSFPIDAQAPDYTDSVDSVLAKFAELAGIAKTSVIQKVGCVKQRLQSVPRPTKPDAAQLDLFQPEDSF